MKRFITIISRSFATIAFFIALSLCAICIIVEEIALLIDSLTCSIKKKIVWNWTPRSKYLLLMKVRSIRTKYEEEYKEALIKNSDDLEKGDRNFLIPLRVKLMADIKDIYRAAKIDRVAGWKIKYVLGPELRVFA